MVKVIIAIIVILAFLLFSWVDWFASGIAVGDPNLYWTVFGAIGSTAGSMIGVAAIVISIVALIMPYIVRLSTDMSEAYAIKPFTPELSSNYMRITVSNTGIRPVLITDVCVGTKKRCARICTASSEILLKSDNSTLPKRLEQGQVFEIGVNREVLREALLEITDKGRIYIRVEEASTGHSLYYRTKWKFQEL